MLNNDLNDRFEVHETPQSITIIFSSKMKNIDRTCDETLRFLMNISKDCSCEESEKGQDCPELETKKPKCSQCFKSHLFAIQLVMREGLTNAVRHGNSLNPSKMVRVLVEMRHNEVLYIEIEDQGKGFDWRNEQHKGIDDIDEDSYHGRGLMIMEQYFSRYWYNDAGNKLTLEKNI
ncbi:MAG: ATP-binding protein [Desulfamplus sp.]|nr:ATP-binding protein [Desulfamplus sp.]